MAENKTQPTDVDPSAFIAGLEHPTRRRDGLTLLAMMQEATDVPPVMWGPSMVGYGRYHYKYASGRQGDALAVGFSPRTSGLVLYGLIDAPGAGALLGHLGTHRLGASCLYVPTLAKVDTGVLRELTVLGYAYMTTTDFTSPAP